ncbi:methyltransferase PMT28 [Pelomyxa schiedti]|nr:methyltransferase PMT28 [Pelomyxa schiedti]
MAETVYGASDWQFWIALVLSGLLVCFAGAMSGLTLGLLGLDKLSLRIMTLSGSATRREYATRVLSLVKHHHILLVTLLVSNALAMEALPLCLDRMMPEYASIIVSVTLVLLFGEVIPQAACSRFGLKIGAYSAPMVRLLMIFWLPISIPVGWILDKILGKREGTFYSRPELKELMLFHGEAVTHVTDEGSEILTPTEITITCGALDLCTKTAQDAMIPIDRVRAVEVDAPLTTAVLQKIAHSDSDEIPVYKGSLGQLRGTINTQGILAASVFSQTSSESVMPPNRKPVQIDGTPNASSSTTSAAAPSLLDLGESQDKGKEPDTSLVSSNTTLTPRSVGIAFAPWVDTRMPLCNVLIELRSAHSNTAFVRSGEFELTAVGIVTISDVLHALLNAYEGDVTHLPGHSPHREVSTAQAAKEIVLFCNDHNPAIQEEEHGTLFE